MNETFPWLIPFLITNFIFMWLLCDAQDYEDKTSIYSDSLRCPECGGSIQPIKGKPYGECKKCGYKTNDPR